MQFLREKNEVVPSFDNLLENDLGVVDELVLLASKIRQEVCGI
jgi:hypothetical protein